MRAAHYVVGPDWPIDMLLYADDLEVLGPGKKGRIGAVLAFLVLAAYGSPLQMEEAERGAMHRVDRIGHRLCPIQDGAFSQTS